MGKLVDERGLSIWFDQLRKLVGMLQAQHEADRFFFFASWQMCGKDFGSERTPGGRSPQLRLHLWRPVEHSLEGKKLIFLAGGVSKRLGETRLSWMVWFLRMSYCGTRLRTEEAHRSRCQGGRSTLSASWGATWPCKGDPLQSPLESKEWVDVSGSEVQKQRTECGFVDLYFS